MSDLLPLACLTLCALLIAALAWQQQEHGRERAGWVQERTALLERCVPGLVLTAPATALETRAYGTDADEWRVHQAREQAALEGRG